MTDHSNTVSSRTLRRRLCFIGLAFFIGLGIALLAAEGVARIYFASNPNGYEDMRARLAGEIPAGPRDALVIGQPYLLYVPTPNYRNGRNYHNRGGYRGKAVAMERAAGIKRILCLGGSTTYGTETEDADLAYPAQLEARLNAALPAGADRVEVINGGVPNASSAELVTQYHFKFHYFRPDLVIINTGGNDVGAISGWGPDTTPVYYQPDYSHWRQALRIPQPLSPSGRVLMRSRFAALILITLLHGADAGSAAIGRPEGLPPPTVWHPAAADPDRTADIVDADLAFTHNIISVIDAVRRDGGRVLLVPFRLSPHEGEHDLTDAEMIQIQRHERILARIAADRNAAFAPFPAAAISTANWVDECHLNEDGCGEKAAYIADFARALLWPQPSPDDTSPAQ